MFAYNIIAIRKNLIGIVSVIKEMPGNNTSDVDSTLCVSKAVLFSGHNDVDHIGEEVLNSLDEKIKVSVDCSMLGRFSRRVYYSGD
jgi:hypothetical protein